jgi:UDP-N-acetyl-alpha-D-muramoyl-L-alanyl-L-glutamate epimerase
MLASPKRRTVFVMRRAHDGRVLSLETIRWHGAQLSIGWAVDGYRFTTSLWYDSVDWHDLTRRFGLPATEALAFHIAMFELDKGISFRPTELRVAEPWSDLVTDALLVLWRTVTHRVWAQWRYEHGLADYAGPIYRGSSALAPAMTRPVVDRGDGERESGRGSNTLWFCGGGKDSLLASTVLDAADVAYDAFAYTHSVYGPAERQMGLVERLIGGTAARATHRLFVFDDAVDVPLGRLPGVDDGAYVLAAETPASLFAALPIALAHGYDHLVVAHERSANAPNLRWLDTGEDVNHQWGKSLEAEQLLAEYIDTHLLPGTRYYSVLAPVHDDGSRRGCH